MKMKALLLGLLLMGSLSSVAFAEETAPPPHMNKGAWKSMTPEQRQAKRAAFHEKFKSMTPEEKQALLEKRKAHFKSLPPEQQQAKRAEFREKFKSLSPEKQQAIREHMAERRASRQHGAPSQ